MPANITIIHTRDFIRATPDGTLDLLASRKVLTDVVSKIKIAGAHHVLIDTRATEADLSTTDLFELGNAVAGERALARNTVAILVTPEEKANAEFLENVALNRGANLRAFTGFETAINWLIMKAQG